MLYAAQACDDTEAVLEQRSAPACESLPSVEQMNVSAPHSSANSRLAAERESTLTCT
jgi:hypothetical protein